MKHELLDAFANFFQIANVTLFPVNVIYEFDLLISWKIVAPIVSWV